mgnify:CR=1 FL=1
MPHARARCGMAPMRLVAIHTLSSRVSHAIPTSTKPNGARPTCFLSPFAGSKSGKKKPAKSGKLSSSRAVATLDDKLRRVANSETGFADLPKELTDRGPAVALAYTYLGDAVWEVYARQHMILRKSNDAAKSGTKNVALRPMEATKRGWCSSVAMHGHLMRLIDGNVLSEQELSILKWGKDFGHESRSGHKSEAHKEASALEALVCYWYLFDSERLHFILETLGMTLCGRPLFGVNSDAVRGAVLGAMDGLRIDDDEVAEVSENVNDDDTRDAPSTPSGDTTSTTIVSSADEIASLKNRIQELEEELLMSKRAARLMRQRK